MELCKVHNSMSCMVWFKGHLFLMHRQVYVVCTYPWSLVERLPIPYSMNGSLKMAATCQDMKRLPFGTDPENNVCVFFSSFIKSQNGILQNSFRANARGDVINFWTFLLTFYITHLRISIYRIWMWIRLITPWNAVSLNISHHTIAGRYHRWSQCLL